MQKNSFISGRSHKSKFNYKQSFRFELSSSSSNKQKEGEQQSGSQSEDINLKSNQSSRSLDKSPNFNQAANDADISELSDDEPPQINAVYASNQQEA